MATNDNAPGPYVGFDESETVEFKESWDESAMKDIAAFANADGGSVYLGVDDDGFAVGCDASDEAQQSVAQKIRSILGILPSIRVERYGELDVLVLQIPKISGRTVLLRGNAYKRSGTSSMPVPDEDVPALILAQAGRTWDEMPAPTSLEDAIDPEKVRAFIRSAKAKERPRIPDQVQETDPIELVLRNLDLLSNGQPTNAAVLLFGRQPQRIFRNARISIAYFHDINRIEAYDDATGTVFEQINSALQAVNRVYPTQITFDEGAAGNVARRTQRREKPAFPPLALKEALTNAIVHRDYTRTGSEIQVRMFPDRVVLMNPGSLPSSLTVDELRRTPHPSERRNPKIAEVCYIDYWVERYGTGTTRMIELCRRANLPEPEFEAGGSWFRVTLCRDAVTADRLADLGLSERQIQGALHVKERGQITTSEYEELTGVSRATAKRDLDDLVDAGVLERTAEAGRNVAYILASASS